MASSSSTSEELQMEDEEDLEEEMRRARMQIFESRDHEVVKTPVPKPPQRSLEDHVRWLEDLRAKLQGELQNKSQEDLASQEEVPGEVPEPFKSPALL